VRERDSRFGTDWDKVRAHTLPTKSAAEIKVLTAALSIALFVLIHR
jgi:hypothetical protein